MTAIASLARFAGKSVALAAALALLSACGKPDLKSAREDISKFDAMSPQTVLCNRNELANFRAAARRYVKATRANGETWPDFSYRNRRPDDLTVTLLAGHYMSAISASDMGRAAWHLGELQPDWASFGAYNEADGIARPNKAMLKQGSKYACDDAVKYSYALAEHELALNYWRERMVQENYLSDRPQQMKAELFKRATKRVADDMRRLMRLERDLAKSIDHAQLASR